MAVFILFYSASEMYQDSDYVNSDFELDEITGESYALYEKSEIYRAIDEVFKGVKSEEINLK